MPAPRTPSEATSDDHAKRARVGESSMYVDLLTHALAKWEDEVSDEVLIDHVLTCRLTMLSTSTTPEESAYTLLATEIAYDRALIKLCVSRSLAVDFAHFAHPQKERRRLERSLAAVGVDLTSLSRRRR